MRRIVLSRLAQSIPIMVAVLVISFLLIRVGGGDPSGAILGVGGTAAQRARIREELGLDRPVVVQLVDYLGGIVHGQLGSSLVNGRAVASTLGQALPVTLSLTIGALLVSLAVGIPLGILTATRGGRTDRAVQVVTVFFMAVPGFWLALMLMVFFGVTLRWFPTSGYVEFSAGPGRWFEHLVLPVAALAATATAAIALQTRARMIEVLDQDFVRTLESSGVGRRSIVLRHALRNAGGTIVTVAGLQFIGLLGAVMFIEQVFALPGIGRIAVQAAVQHDYTVLQGVILALTVLVIVTNLVVELSRSWLTPKVRLA